MERASWSTKLFCLALPARSPPSSCCQLQGNRTPLDIAVEKKNYDMARYILNCISSKESDKEEVLTARTVVSSSVERAMHRVGRA